ncbi:fatty acid desaturase [Limibacter armeniacum]|uniref:fatty acid desaturase n=1 Tax=Limibacter armeniacum TaxID=466084 RepID=UPI002FE64647
MVNPQDYIQEAPWAKVDMPRNEFRQFMQKNNLYGILNTLLWIISLFGTGYLAYLSLDSYWVIPAFFLYGVMYCACDARWHESSHGTVFKTPWMNTALCFIATAMQQRDIIFTNWSHVRHHSYTIINDIDPEITVTRPPTFWEHFLNFFSLGESKYYIPVLVKHAFGIVSEDARKFVPEEEYNRMFWWARASLLLNLIPIIVAGLTQSWLPLLFVGPLPKMYGNIIQRSFVLAQHAGLDEDVWDHRKNSRTILVNPFFGFLFMNMQYHVEHHMYPLMPFHQLPRFHRRVQDQMPKPYKGMIEVYREMIPALIKQSKDTTYFIDRKVPGAEEPQKVVRIKEMEASSAMIPMAAKGAETVMANQTTSAVPEELEWHAVTSVKDLASNDVINVKIEGTDYAIVHTDKGEYYSVSGICTHEHAYMADGVVESCTISCPKHNSKFDLKTGNALNRPAKKALKTYPVKVEDGQVLIGLAAETIKS